MSTKVWGIIYKSYYDRATNLNIFIEKLKIVNPKERMFLIFIFIFGLVCTYFTIYVPNCHRRINIVCNQDIYLTIAMICEFIILFYFFIIENRLPIYTYKDKKTKLGSYSSDINLDRYLFFKKNLEEHQIKKKSVEQCLELADMKIDMVSSDKFNARIADLKFLLGFGLGIVGTIWKQLQTRDLLIMFLFFCIVLCLLTIVSFLIPSKIEKAKELKYFMMLYVAEKNISENL
jgi:hypothetical protein